MLRIKGLLCKDSKWIKRLHLHILTPSVFSYPRPMRRRAPQLRALTPCPVPAPTMAATETWQVITFLNECLSVERKTSLFHHYRRQLSFTDLWNPVQNIHSPGENWDNSVMPTRDIECFCRLWRVPALGRDLGKTFQKTMFRYSGSKSSKIVTVD